MKPTTKRVACSCGKWAQYTATVKIHDCLNVRIYACECGEEYESIHYKYDPATCDHQWQVKDYDFKDGVYNWKAGVRMGCDKCGQVRLRRLDSETMGIREAWDMEDPKVLKLLRLTKDTARFHGLGDTS